MIETRLNIPTSFFDEEVRNDFLVTREVKKLWAVELDLLAELDRVCKKHGLRYAANGGTLLGAIRHKGFIPWDDDIDVMMPRSDYEKLIKLAPTEFTSPYYLESIHSDPETLMWFAKLKNSATAAIEYPYNPERNQGIFIDIFPLDNVADDGRKVLEQRKRALRYRKLSAIIGYTFTKYKPEDSLFRQMQVSCLKVVFKLLGIGFPKAVEYFFKSENALRHYNGTETSYFSTTLGLHLDKPLYDKVLLNDFDHLEVVPFEFFQIPVPPHYEQNLNEMYGNWRDFVKGTSLHSLQMFDTDRSYKEVMNDYFQSRK